MRMSRCVWTCLAAMLASAACRSPRAEHAALLAADRAWCESQGDPEAFASFVADDAVFLPAGLPPAAGRDAFLAVSAELFAAPGTSLTWRPSRAEVSPSADLGYTIGSYELTVSGVTSAGKYLTAWRRAPDGRWTVVADCYNADAPTPE